VLNTLTGHDFEDAFKEWQNGWDRCIRAEGDYFEGVVAESRPNLVFNRKFSDGSL
jgi:hypothetical protein